MTAPRKSYCSNLTSTLSSTLYGWVPRVVPEHWWRRFPSATYMNGNPVCGKGLYFFSLDGKGAGKTIGTLARAALNNTESGRSYCYMTPFNVAIVVTNKDDVRTLLGQHRNNFLMYDSTGSFELPFGENGILSTKDAKQHEIERRKYDNGFGLHRIPEDAKGMQKIADRFKNQVYHQKIVEIGEFASIAMMTGISELKLNITHGVVNDQKTPEVNQKDQRDVSKIIHNVTTEIATGKLQLANKLLPRRVVKTFFPLTTMGKQLAAGEKLLKTKFLRPNSEQIKSTKNFLNPDCNPNIDLESKEAINKTKETFVAGHDTTKILLRAALTLLADSNHKDKLCALQQELLKKKNPSMKLKPDEIMDLPYLDAVVQETLRLYPPVPDIVFKVKDKFTFGGGTVYPGDIFIISPRTVHTNPKLWGDDAHEFKPERFLNVRPTELLYKFFPFGFGSKICPGQYFAKMEVKTMLANLLTEFDIEFVDSRLHHPFPFHQVFSLRFDDEQVYLRFTPKKPQEAIKEEFRNEPRRMGI